MDKYIKIRDDFPGHYNSDYAFYEYHQKNKIPEIFKVLRESKYDYTLDLPVYDNSNEYIINKGYCEEIEMINYDDFCNILDNLEDF